MSKPEQKWYLVKTLSANVDVASNSKYYQHNKSRRWPTWTSWQYSGLPLLSTRGGFKYVHSPPLFYKTFTRVIIIIIPLSKVITVLLASKSITPFTKMFAINTPYYMLVFMQKLCAKIPEVRWNEQSQIRRFEPHNSMKEHNFAPII